MVKILYILTKSGIGGAQKYVKDLAENLDKKNFEVKILYGGTGINPEGRPASNGVKWLSNKTQPWFLFINDWMAVFEIAGILKREMPDVIHLNSSKAGFIGAIAVQIHKLRLIFRSPLSQRLEPNFRTSDFLKIKIPNAPKVIFTAHGWVFNPTNELNWLVRYFYIFLHWFAAKFQDKIICVSEYDYNLALQFNICDKEKLETIHNGIDANIKFLSKKEAREKIIQKIKTATSPNPSPLSSSGEQRETRGSIFPDSHFSTEGRSASGGRGNDKWPWIGSIGRLVKEKNYETFIEAAKSVSDAYFFIIGEGPEIEKLKVQSQKSKVADRFFIIPPMGNDSIYLKAFDVFAMSSVKEGLPYILLEAMAAELPIVITEAGGMPELIQNHENGLMVAQKNPEALAHAIGGLLANPSIAKDLAKKAKEAVIRKFSLREMVQKTEEVYLTK